MDARSNLREACRKNVYLFSLYLGILNATANLRSWHRTGTTHESFDLPTSIQYIDEVYEEYLRVGGLQPTDIRGKTVLEIGPGDSLGVAIRFLIDGATRVVSIDRFRQFRDSEKEQRIYDALLKRAPQTTRNEISSIIRKTAQGCEFDNEKLDYRIFSAAENLRTTSEFDMTVSRSVLEHVWDLENAFQSTLRSMKPGGLMVHRVDLRGHGFLVERNEMFFLTLPDWWWKLIGSRTGFMNRHRASHYRELLDRHDLVIHRWITNHTFAEESLRLIRPKLAVRFRKLSNEDLLVAGFSFAASRRSPQ